MCTLSWRLDGSGYDLLFNRDESRARSRALPPSVLEADGCRVIAPSDADHGGTWIAANERGVTLALLNHYEAATAIGDSAGGGARSRGLLVRDLAASPAIEDAVGAVDIVEARRYRPFCLVAFAPGRAPVALRFDGEALDRRPLTDDDLPVVSSGYDSGEVARRRRETFRSAISLARDPGDVETRLAIHRGHDPERGAYSICMHRPDARTVSLSRVRVEPGRVRFWYCPDAPCEGELLPPVDIPRRPIPGAGS